MRYRDRYIKPKHNEPDFYPAQTRAMLSKMSNRALVALMAHHQAKPKQTDIEVSVITLAAEELANPWRDNLSPDQVIPNETKEATRRQNELITLELRAGLNIRSATP